jgi:hypothetical protein
MKITHAKARRGRVSPEYSAWCEMIKRCENSRSKFFGHYGGRGISIFPEWRADFSAFLRDVGPKPSPRHSLDRIDNNGNYAPGNVRWATSIEQANNKRNNREISAHGRTQTLAEWAREIGLRASTIWTRLELGWSPTEAVDPALHGASTRTHCPKQHPYDESNTYIYRGRRFCRACQRLAAAASRRVSS